MEENNTQEIHEAEHVLPNELRQLRRDVRREAREAATGEDLTTGQRVADAVSEMMRSWWFIIIQSVILAEWVVLKLVGWIKLDKLREQEMLELSKAVRELTELLAAKPAASSGPTPTFAA